MENKPLVSINVSGSQTLVFYEHFLIYRGAHIKYQDISGMSYLLTNTKHSINFIPTHTTTSFEIKLEANGEVYDVKSSAGSFMLFESEGRKEKTETFGKLVHILDNLIKPFVVINLLNKYASGGDIRLGSITLKRDGLYKDRFWRDPEFMPWKEYYNSALSKGSLYIYRDDVGDKKYKLYASCAMSVMNAVVMPDLLTYIFQKNGIIDEATTRELQKRKKELAIEDEKPESTPKTEKGFCWSCSVPIDEKDQKFCTHCGSKL